MLLFDRFAQKRKAGISAVELKALQGNLPFIVKIIFDPEIKSKAGKEFTNKKKKKFGIGLTGSGLGNASGKSSRASVRFSVFPWQKVNVIASVSSPVLNTT